MAALYPGTSVSGYNSNPPPDDGTTVTTNLITWAGIKSKIGDPLNTFDSSVDSNITSAFGKTLDGATVISTGSSYPATAADQGRLIKATASGITITTPDAGTVHAPFMFAINNQSTGTITLAGNATGAQTVDGSTSQTIQTGGSCIVKTDGTNWFTIGLKPAGNTLAPSNYGFTDPVNCNLNCTVGSNLLTVALKTKAGNDPSASDPVQVAFRDTTVANGDPVWVSVTSALSISTNAVGATLGTQNGSVPFRLWVVIFNNAGTAVLALWHSGAGSAQVTINPLNEGILQSTSSIGASATNPGTFYTPNGTTLSSCAFRILGYLDYANGLTTAGTYASVPTVVQLFGPGIKKPGDILTFQVAISQTGTTTSSATFQATNPSITYNISSPTSAVLVRAFGNVSVSGVSTQIAIVQLGRNSNSNLFGTTAYVNMTSGSSTQSSVSVEGVDSPGTNASTTYQAYLRADGSHNATYGGTMNGFNTSSTLTIQELMA